MRWLSQEVQENIHREQRLRRQHQQTQDQLKTLRQSRDSEHAALTQRLDQQEKLLQSLNAEKQGTRTLFKKEKRENNQSSSKKNTHIFVFLLKSIRFEGSAVCCVLRVGGLF